MTKWKLRAATLVALTVSATTVAFAPAATATPPSTFRWLGLGATFSRSAGWQLESPSGVYRAIFQSDGNWVVYHGSKAIWASNTSGRGITLNFANGAEDISWGDVFINRASGGNPTIWDNNRVTGDTSYLYMDMQNDGNFVEYTSSAHPIWASNTNGR